MDKEILTNNCVSGRKPPILPKPKIIPEKPCFRVSKSAVSPSISLSLAHAQSPSIKSDDECNLKLDESLTLQSPGNFLVKWKPVDDVCDVHNSSKTPLSESAHCINESGGENGEQSDSDGHSLNSSKSLDVSCPVYQENTSYSSEQCDGFPSDVIITESKEKSVFMIAKEFMTSEQAYVQTLRLLVVDFKNHLESYNCSLGEYDKVVSSLPQLLQFHEGLLADLEQRVSDWAAWLSIADVIVKKGPFLKLYSSYMKDYEAQQLALDECCVRNPKFFQALQSFESSAVCKKLALKHYMLKPVQRIPQYRLLLERYLSRLDEGSGEYVNATTALAIVREVLDHANSTIKQSDNLSKLLELQSRLVNYEIIKPGRSFIKEGELQKLSRKEIQPRYLILLSDCLLYTLYSASYLRMKYELPLAGMRVWSAEDCTEFDVRTSTRSFTLKARDDEECAQWMTSIQSAILENMERQRTFATHEGTRSETTPTGNDPCGQGKEAPVWIPDKKTTMCQICTAEFTVTFRRHHCRCCGRVVCWVCSNNRAPLQYRKFHAKRVCYECYDYLKNEFEDPSSNIINCIRDTLSLDESNTTSTFEALKSSFKRFDSPNRPRINVPTWRIQATGNVAMNGWLDTKEKRCWKRVWFVLKDQVLYYYKASRDVMAYKTLPVLGYKIDQPIDSVDEMDKRALFRLTHDNQMPLLFHAPSVRDAELWISALNEAAILT